jgi:acyl dehydratase
MALSPATLRLDAQGQACGQSHISRGKTCRKRGSFPTGKAIAAGLGVAAVGAGAFALARRSPRVFASGAQPRLPGITAKALLPAGRTRQSKTQRMRANTQAAMRTAEGRIAQTAREEVRRLGQIGNTMAATGEATGMAVKLTARELRLRTEAARRRYEPGYRKPRRDSYIQHYAPVQLQPPTRRDTEDGKKYSKVVTNPDTGRKNRIRYGAKGYKIAPGTDKGDRYCARSFGDMKSHGKNCAGADRTTPLCLSRTKWKCSGKTSRRS